ncbi:MAG: pyruvate dehydrogenase (acetyl-transferring) E1 component subunit alpha [Alphaproteobacteria bacterium]|nr:MAG: pyruvate dehydrogenase (acetyl-transferring) E1 component subunit alpha [Alphaproteobacteria bacterium]
MQDRPAAEEIVARFEIARTAFLDPDGTPRAPLPDFARDRGSLVAMYRAMLLARAFDARAVALQRTGRLGTYPSALGQEAVAVGTAAAMAPGDLLVPSFREHGAQIMRGVRMEELFLYWGGDERGSDFRDQREDFPVCVPVGTQYPHAAGVALAFQLRGEDRVAVAVGGDGSTSRGDFAEALNIAGVWKLPAVFVVANNGWAISVPREAQSAAQTLAQKAVAAGIPEQQCDGNDVIAVRATVAAALARARAGQGPSLIECLTYRLADHTTADDASRYRDDAAVSARWAEEPVRRLRAHLARAHGWSAAEEEALHAGIAAEVDAATEAYLATPPQPATAIVDYLYAALPPDLARLRARLEGQDG